MKYYIIPNNFEVIETIEADNAENALIDFAFHMDSNMGTYFKAVTEGQYKRIMHNQCSEMHEKFVTDWMIDTLITDFNLDEKSAKDYGKRAYEIYSEGIGLTEYESVEAAYDEYMETQEED